MPLCRTCGEEKDVSLFYVVRSKEPNWCKACRSAYRKEAYRANPQPHIERATAYQQAHREERREYHRDWTERNRERVNRVAREQANERHAHRTPEQRKLLYAKVRTYQRRYHAEHRAERNAYQRSWAIANRDMVYDAVRRHKARRRGAPIVEKIDRDAIIARDASTCYLCGLVLERHEVTLDHVIPLARGGAHTADNLKVACRPCNVGKRERLLHELPNPPKSPVQLSLMGESNERPPTRRHRLQLALPIRD